jgi:hypothetical protein
LTERSTRDFLRAEHRALVHIETEVPALLDCLAAFEPAVIEKWIGRQTR